MFLRDSVRMRLLVGLGSLLQRWRPARRASARATSYSIGIDPDAPLVIQIYNRLVGLALLDRVARRLAPGASTDREMLVRIVHWVHENVAPQYAGPDRVVSDDLLSILRRGYGHCDQSAHAFAALSRSVGYDSRLLFLRAADGTSPHTVAEVRVGARWVLVDPWIGLVFVDEAGRLLAVDDVRARPEILRIYARLAPVGVSSFENATRFRAFPYAGLNAIVANLVTRLRRRRAGSGHVASLPRPSDAAIQRMEAARWAHLEGRYAEATGRYEEVLREDLPRDMISSVRFFLGLAHLRAGSAGEAVAAFDAAVEAGPSGDWIPTIRYFRAEARLATGDAVGAAADLRAARTPLATSRLAALEVVSPAVP